MSQTEEIKAHELVTIGITCYNAESTIERAINSAFAQNWPKLEIIIVACRNKKEPIAAREAKT